MKHEERSMEANTFEALRPVSLLVKPRLDDFSFESFLEIRDGKNYELQVPV